MMRVQHTSNVTLTSQFQFVQLKKTKKVLEGPKKSQKLSNLKVKHLKPFQSRFEKLLHLSSSQFLGRFFIQSVWSVLRYGIKKTVDGVDL